MHNIQTPPTLEEILSKAPGNPVLWQLFLADLAGAMQCDSGFLSIADLGRGGGIHHLYGYNVAPEQQSCFERNLLKLTVSTPALSQHAAWKPAKHCLFHG